MNNEIKEILDKLKESALWYDDSKDLLDYITNLQQEKEDYKSRCEKAIEYVNNKNIYDEEYGEFIYYDYLIHDNLLNILQNGSDNND